MPKLPKDRADGAEKQEAGEFKPVKPGRYVVKLIEVEEGVTGEKSTNPGTEKWVWKTQIDTDYHPELQKGRWQSRFNEHVPLSENMDWKMKQLFTSFGYTPDSDTDEIIEDADARAVAYVKDGKDIVTGEKRSEVSRYVPYEAEKWADKYAPKKDDDDETDDNQ